MHSVVCKTAFYMLPDGVEIENIAVYLHYVFLNVGNFTNVKLYRFNFQKKTI